jgi:NADH-quinone oxidoreductase subunit J
MASLNMPLSTGIALFAGVCAVALTGLILFSRNLYVCALALLGVLLQASVLFYFSGAPLLAFLQIMIYAGAVLVLVVVAIMAAPLKAGKLWSDFSLPRPLTLLGVLFPAVVLAILLCGAPAAPAAGASGEAALGAVLFGPYALATEAVTILMLLASLAVVGERK